MDSSEEDSDPGEPGDTGEARAQRLHLLATLKREQRALEEKKGALGARLAEERAACLRLRVSIRLEQAGGILCRNFTKKLKEPAQMPVSLSRIVFFHCKILPPMQERIRRQKLSQFPGIGFGKPNLMD